MNEGLIVSRLHVTILLFSLGEYVIILELHSRSSRCGSFTLLRPHYTQTSSLMRIPPEVSFDFSEISAMVTLRSCHQYLEVMSTFGCLQRCALKHVVVTNVNWQVRDECFWCEGGIVSSTHRQ
jgi:hypothetical protein